VQSERVVVVQAGGGRPRKGARDGGGASGANSDGQALVGGGLAGVEVAERRQQRHHARFVHRGGEIVVAGRSAGETGPGGVQCASRIARPYLCQGFGDPRSRAGGESPIPGETDALLGEVEGGVAFAEVEGQEGELSEGVDPLLILGRGRAVDGLAQPMGAVGNRELDQQRERSTSKGLQIVEARGVPESIMAMTWESATGRGGLRCPDPSRMPWLARRPDNPRFHLWPARSRQRCSAGLVRPRSPPGPRRGDAIAVSCQQVPRGGGACALHWGLGQVGHPKPGARPRPLHHGLLDTGGATGNRANTWPPRARTRWSWP